MNKTENAAQESDLSQAPTTAGPFLRGHRSHVLFMLVLVYTLNFADRQILAILAEPIKIELGLKDWQVGFLTGTAFALLYAILGIPIARLADRMHRVNIITIALAVWSAMTMLCAVTVNFTQLALARVGVGIGEAGGSPPSVSVLADYFPRRERSTAMGIYALGPSIGTFIGFLVGGWINELYGWRAALLTVGMPGIVLAVVLKLTVKEPKREFSEPATTTDTPNFWETLRVLWSIKTFRLVNLAAAAAAFTFYGVLIWIPTYLIRSFDMSTGEVGTALGILAGAGGGTGAFLGGWLADKLSKKDIRWQMRVPAIAMALLLPFLLLTINADTPQLAFVFLAPTYMVAFAYTGPTWAILQTVAPVQMRATSTAIMLLIVNLVGLGLGPPFIGIISDIFHSDADTSGLRYAIGMSAVVCLLASFVYFLASRTTENDIPADALK